MRNTLRTCEGAGRGSGWAGVGKRQVCHLHCQIPASGTVKRRQGGMTASGAGSQTASGCPPPQRPRRLRPPAAPPRQTPRSWAAAWPAAAAAPAGAAVGSRRAAAHSRGAAARSLGAAAHSRQAAGGPRRAAERPCRAAARRGAGCRKGWPAGLVADNLQVRRAGGALQMGARGRCSGEAAGGGGDAAATALAKRCGGITEVRLYFCTHQEAPQALQGGPEGP